MKHSYDDIIKRIDESPLWWDENGTPRYDPFTPTLCPDVYADIAILLRVSCQSCGRQFDVEMHGEEIFGRTIQLNQVKELHYGDPPRHGCVGDTMNCNDLMILQVWRRHVDHPEFWDWHRKSELEGPIP